MTRAAEKEGELSAWLRERGSALIGYSGGVDSAYLACLATEILGADRVLAVIGRSPSYPAEQWEAARRIAREHHVPVLEIATEELEDPHYAANPSNRCYFCKHELWSKLVPIAREHALAVVVDGTNADDLTGHRPGAQAAREAGVESPLAIVGFTKSEIRERSRARGLATWAQPSSPCLSSRIPYGTSVTIERLDQIERAERALRALGIAGDLRVRHHGALARVELSRDALGTWLDPAREGEVRAALIACGFESVAIDPRGYRSGSLNVLTESVIPSGASVSERSRGIPVYRSPTSGDPSPRSG
jgi:pyridinium-3,5-biscarboxylic acid mononucleotide sulfurtransferase